MSNVVKFPKAFKELDNPYRYKMIYGGRGKGASWTVARKLLLRGVENKLLILCTRELQKSIKQSVHRLLSDQVEKLGLSAFYDVNGQTIRGINGTEFIFLGTKYNPDEIKSTEGIDICWIEEAHNITEASWEIIDPTIRKEESEIWATWNTRFKFDTLHKMFVIDTPPPGSLVLYINHDQNPYFPEVLRKQMQHMKETNYEKYLNVWKGQLKSLASGAIFGKQIIELKKKNRLTYIPIQKNCEVDTFSDLGKKDQTAFWMMQRVGMEYRFFDYFEGSGEEVDYYTKFLKAMNYNYGTHYMPHDSAHDRLGMKRNIKEQFEDGGISPIEVVPVVDHKTTAIQLGRDILANCWFHIGKDDKIPDEECEGYLDWLPDDMNTRTKRAERGFEAMCNYRYKYNDDDKVFQQKPHHDWASNGADAFLQFAQGYDPKDDDWGGDLNYQHGSIA